MNKLLSCNAARRSLGAGLVAAGCIWCASAVFAQENQEQGDSERMTNAAWKALEARDFDAAIRRAQQCIEEFRDDAVDLQDELTEKQVPEPGIGGRLTEDERAEIFDRGPLNDVATCYFIQGEAYVELSGGGTRAERKDNLARAKSAYEAAAKFTYARTYDPKNNGSFWDPAKKANSRLKSINPDRRE